jgi:putative endopeptidase
MRRLRKREGRVNSAGEMQTLILILVLFSVAAWGNSENGIHPEFMRTDVDPCEDFYEYACGTWQKTTPLPEDRSHWDRGFTEIAARNEGELIKVLNGYAAGHAVPPNPYVRQLGDSFAACMNEKGIAKNARREFRDFIRPIRSLKRLGDLPVVLADLHLAGVDALFAGGPGQDFKNPTERVFAVGQGGMGLPSPEYYLSDKTEMKALRDQYLKFVTESLVIAGYSNRRAKPAAEKILQFETSLANASKTPVEMRDIDALQNRLERKGLKELAPSFQWDAYFGRLGIPQFQKVNVMVPKFMSTLSELLTRMPLEDLRAYLLAHSFARAAWAMDPVAVDTLFRFESGLSGMTKIPPRDRFCLDEVTRNMGFALSQAFVDLTFGAESKKAALEMVRRLKLEMKQTLETAEWMDDETRKRALVKLDSQAVLMGYPDVWRIYDGIVVSRESMLKNRVAAQTFNTKFELNRIETTVDREEWQIPPLIVNAVNMISQNAIFFPAGILQDPNFKLGRSETVNYGAMGTIVGHEITHGFDDQGMNFDEQGSLSNWWSKKTRETFEKKAACVVDQYNAYVVEGDLHVNGRLVQGEAIADLGGMKLSYAAWKRLRSELKTKETGEFAGDRGFFLSLAQAWCVKSSAAAEKSQTLTNPHALGRFRINGTVRNIPAFAKAFGCRVGAKLAPEKPCVVW